MPGAMEKQWQLLDPNPRTTALLVREIGCSPLVARLLAIRGIRSKIDANRFLYPSLGHLTPPLAMAGMADAVARIQRAIDAGEKILVYGDYDADGITATAVLVSFLIRCGARVNYYIPHRMTEGYGMGSDFVLRRAQPAGVGLIITVDCGSSNAAAVTRARKIGIDTIITDHHPIGRLPEDAVAVINPTRADCPAQLAHLAGVGVAFYLVIALRAGLRDAGFWKHRREPNLKKLCDLVALGTVADVAPLVGENRTFTATGLNQINTAARPGIRALMAGIASGQAPMDAEAIAYRLAPRLNAAGRLAHARMACQLLLTDRHATAIRLAAALSRLNSRRQDLENALVRAILDDMTGVSAAALPQVLVVDGSGWHEGILGIVASRLSREFHRPAVVISTQNGTGKGSARSIPGIDINAALNRCADLLTRFGGHPQAAGLALPSADIPRFRSQMEAVVTEMAAAVDTRPSLFIDAPLPPW